MSIDVANIESQSEEPQECILGAVLVCGWNVRAWAFLESMKSCHNIRILFKNNTTLSVREIINRVYADGRIEMGDSFEKTPVDHYLHSGDISNEVVGTPICCRLASRPGDDIVIWSLPLGGDQIFLDPVKFWRSRTNT
jgi:hypothetical protein